MNPFQTAYARSNTAAQAMHMNPAAVHTALGVMTAAQLAPLVGGVIDTTMGNTHGFNSGEIPLNYLIAALGGGITTGGIIGSEAINKKLDTYYKGVQDKTKSNVSANDPEMKAKLKEIHRTKGVEAAQAYYASQKNAASEPGREGSYTIAGAGKRRLAGNLLSSLIGAGVSLPLMLDDSY